MSDKNEYKELLKLLDVTATQIPSSVSIPPEVIEKMKDGARVIVHHGLGWVARVLLRGTGVVSNLLRTR